MSSKKIAVIAHDAGGAEIIAAWMKRHLQNEFSLFLEGPAIKVFERRVHPTPQFDDFSQIENFLKAKKPDLVITSSNWGADIEKKVWKMCEELQLKSVLFVDGIGDFRYTFEWNGKTIFPKEVWVANEYAIENIANLKMPRESIKQEKNYYFVDMAERVKTQEKTEQDSNRILYTAENISAYEAEHNLTDRRSRGYNEVEALEYFFEKTQAGSFGDNPKIRVRPHPTESTEKYSAILKKFVALNPEFSEHGSGLESDLAWAQKVVGCESTALLAALACGREVFSCIPLKARTGCRFPHKEIKRI
ncbi:MAG: hypothetical protein J0L93_05000 [Deltaproteobacteria bacterium]|nr:hypothetical protein [Deltaproteobacteria bacterium]